MPFKKDTHSVSLAGAGSGNPTGFQEHLKGTHFFRGFAGMPLGALLCLIAGQALILRYFVQAGWFLILLGFAWCLLTFLRSHWTATAFPAGAGEFSPALPGSARWIISVWEHPSFPLWAAWTGWVFVCLGILCAPNLRYALPPFLKAPFQQGGWLLAGGVGILALAFRKERSGILTADWEARSTRLSLCVILAVAAFLRFYRIGDSTGTYWDDWAEEIIDPRNLLDFGNPQLIYPLGSREPFFTYFTSLIWAFFPDATGIFIQRLSCALLDMATLVTLYFLGKELGGRRVGIFAVALGAISKPLILKCLVGMRLSSLPLAVALVLWLYFRVIRKPSLARFLQFGTALAFGLYTYTAFRPWFPFLAFCLLAWVVTQKGERPLRWPQGALLGGICSAIILVYMVINSYWTLQHPLVHFFLVPWVQSLTAILLFFLWMSCLKEAFSTQKGFKTVHWAISILWASLLAWPILSRPEIIYRMTGLSLVQQSGGHLSLELVHRVMDSFVLTLKTLFVGGPERADMGIDGDAYLDFSTQALFFLGLAYFLIWPSWKKLVIFLAVGVGFSARVLSSDPHSGKIVACVIPLILLAALGLDRLLRTLSGPDRAGWNRSALLLLAVLWVWGARTNFDRIYRQWAFVNVNCNVAMGRECSKLARDHRLYLGAFGGGMASGSSQNVLQEGNGAFFLQTNNPISLGALEHPKDTVVFLPGADVANRTRIQREFPGATWSDFFRGPWQSAAEPTLVMKVVIPAGQLDGNPAKMFYVQRPGPIFWVRDYFMGRYGLARGIISCEDGQVTASAPLPPQVPGGSSCRLRGTYRSLSKGRVTFSTTTGNFVWLKVDGKKIFDLRPEGGAETASGSIDLGKGDHSVEVIVYLRLDNRIPEVGIKSATGASLGSL